MAHEAFAGQHYNENKTSLIDCYRVALDFGLPAAQRVLEHLSVSSQQAKLSDNMSNSHLKITG